ncbi:phosphopantetheine-binding protein [Streptomyces sp. NBC_00091]|uniref:phosphopantetheine-binding protein n=1 Tax=Streptomyces sp. NBC_00091 TaxID=2975648 RepID=UPI002258374E|nr:phosphopantetheine-binding protein [Streptomyces sp. NBC_00091]MCX5381039.1 acyl carrier protein [Streptomyces sp. NBC_00091]
MSLPEPPADLPGFLALIGEELGLELTEEQARADLDTLPSWDSVHLLRLVMLIEQETGRRVPVSAVLRARSIAQIHAEVLAVTGGRALTPGGLL